MCDSGVYYQASCISLEHWSFVFCFLVASRIFSLFCFLVLDLQLNWKFCESVCLLNPAFLFLVCFVYICIFPLHYGEAITASMLCLLPHPFPSCGRLSIPKLHL